MKYYVTRRLRDFPAWSGAEITLKILGELGRTEEVEEYLEGMEPLSETQINDFLWFEEDFIFMELLGLTREEMEALY